MEEIQEVKKETEVKVPEPAETAWSKSTEDTDFFTFTMEQKVHNQKMQRLMWIIAGCMIGIAALAVLTAVLILPKVLGILSDAQQITAQVQEMTGQAEEVLTQAQDIIAQVKDGDPKKLMDSIDSLAVEGESAMQECVEQVKRAVDILDKMDIESLNTAIENLGKAVSPLAKMFGGR